MQIMNLPQKIGKCIKTNISYLMSVNKSFDILIGKYNYELKKILQRKERK